MADMVFKLRVDDAGTFEQLKAARRDLNKYLKEGLTEAGNAVVLPKARLLAPSRFSINLKAGAVVRSGYITTQGPRETDRIIGLLNYGGVVSVKIVPTKKQAVTIGTTGQVRANVTGARHYKAKLFMEKAVESSASALAERTLPSIMKAFGGMNASG